GLRSTRGSHPWLPTAALSGLKRRTFNNCGQEPRAPTDDTAEPLEGTGSPPSKCIALCRARRGEARLPAVMKMIPSRILSIQILLLAATLAFPAASGGAPGQPPAAKQTPRPAMGWTPPELDLMPGETVL